MIHYALFCILWSKPQTQLIEVPVSEYAMANISQDFGEFHFEADVIEEKMNSVKVIHIPTQISTEAYASSDIQQKSLAIKLEIAEKAASLDCEVRAKPVNQ